MKAGVANLAFPGRAPRGRGRGPLNFANEGEQGPPIFANDDEGELEPLFQGGEDPPLVVERE